MKNLEGIQTKTTFASFSTTWSGWQPILVLWGYTPEGRRALTDVFMAMGASLMSHKNATKGKPARGCTTYFSASAATIVLMRDDGEGRTVACQLAAEDQEWIELCVNRGRLTVLLYDGEEGDLVDTLYGDFQDIIGLRTSVRIGEIPEGSI